MLQQMPRTVFGSHAIKLPFMSLHSCQSPYVNPIYHDSSFQMVLLPPDVIAAGLQ